MRISLSEQEGKPKKRRQPRKRQRSFRSRPSHPTFDSAVAQAWLPTGPSTQSGRPPASPGESETRGRRQPAATASAHAVRQPIAIQGLPVRLLAALLLVGLFAAVVYTSTAEEFFVYRQNTQILGDHYYSADAIYEAARVDEQNIFWIHPEKVGKEIGKLAGIKAVQVHCGLPAQVIIELEERKPVVMWRVESQEHDWWLDEDGVVLPYHGVISDTIFVVDSSVRALEEGVRVEPEGVVRSVQQLSDSLPGTKVFFYHPDRGLSFNYGSGAWGWPVYVGDSSDLARKIQVLQALTDHLAANGIRPRYVDVRRPDTPVYGRIAPAN